ncbi:MAG: peptidylprolyl isomerase [Sebaldella sp.]|nr:peptidylprolyl isomerase [Sebaldella sp.]
MKKVLVILLIIILSISLLAKKSNKEEKKMADVVITVVMKTNKGDINLVLFPDKAPVTVANFVNLAKNGYYDGLKFHRVIEDFMVQGGDPTGTGAGGPGYRFEDEVNNGLNFSEPGILAMANAGPGTNGSQFFITTVPTTWLNDKHTIFGELKSEKDMEVLKSILQGDKIESITISGDGADKILADQKDRVGEWNKVLGY